MNWDKLKKRGKIVLEFIIGAAVATLLWRMVFMMNFEMFNLVVTNFVSAVMFVVIGFLNFYLINRFTPRIDFQQELADGNMAVALVISVCIFAPAFLFALL